jgi:hypothetical protein
MFIVIHLKKEVRTMTFHSSSHWLRPFFSGKKKGNRSPRSDEMYVRGLVEGFYRGLPKSKLPSTDSIKEETGRILSKPFRAREDISEEEIEEAIRELDRQLA